MNEQGLGDTLHFVRYAPLLAVRSATVLVACPPALQPVIETVRGRQRASCRTRGRGGGAGVGGSSTVYAPLSSLPGMFRTTLETIPATVPYVSGGRAARRALARAVRR